MWGGLRSGASGVRASRLVQAWLLFRQWFLRWGSSASQWLRGFLLPLARSWGEGERVCRERRSFLAGSLEGRIRLDCSRQWVGGWRGLLRVDCQIRIRWRRSFWLGWIWGCGLASHQFGTLFCFWCVLVSEGRVYRGMIVKFTQERQSRRCRTPTRLQPRHWHLSDISWSGRTYILLVQRPWIVWGAPFGKYQISPLFTVSIWFLPSSSTAATRIDPARIYPHSD